MYHSMHVPQNKIHTFLREIGVQISAGEIDRILSVDKDIFHKEKEEILETGLKISPYVVTDDTGHRHKGINGYCTHIGNDLFAYFQSSTRKNRINFLKILGGVGASYCINGFSINYYKKQRISEFTLKLLKRANGREFKNDSDWQGFLKRLGIKDKYPVRIATEGALIGGLYKNRIHPALAIVSDDAGQFDVLLHALCWIHTERILGVRLKTHRGFWDVLFSRTKSAKSYIFDRFSAQKCRYSLYRKSTPKLWDALLLRSIP